MSLNLKKTLKYKIKRTNKVDTWKESRKQKPILNLPVLCSIKMHPSCQAIKRNVRCLHESHTPTYVNCQLEIQVNNHSLPNAVEII